MADSELASSTVIIPDSTVWHSSSTENAPNFQPVIGRNSSSIIQPSTRQVSISDQGFFQLGTNQISISEVSPAEISLSQSSTIEIRWKEALNEYFESFLSFFFPETYELIDWTQPPQPLDKELQQITASSETESRIADKLYQVWLLNQEQIWILIHVEIQSHYDVSFEKRMFIYHYRAFDLYENKVSFILLR